MIFSRWYWCNNFWLDCLSYSASLTFKYWESTADVLAFVCFLLLFVCFRGLFFYLLQINWRTQNEFLGAKRLCLSTLSLRQGSDKPGKPWKPFFENSGKTWKAQGKKNWKKWNSGKTQGTFLYDGENFFLELSNWLEINCRILDSYYFSFSETII